MKTLILIFVLLTTTCLYSTIINVPADQPTIQDGIVAAAETDTVLVADGIYFENINFYGQAITVASNFLIDADPLHIDNTIINGSQTMNPDYGSCVMFLSGEDTTSVLTGFTITEGTGCLTQPLNANVGGGIFCDSSSPKIVSNIVTNNSTDYAGGICIKGSSPILLNNVISYNTVTFNNAGISIVIGSNPYLEGNVISNNTANDHIGGIMISDSSPTLVGNVIKDNSALDSSGGVWVQLSSNTTFKNNIICDNTAETYVGGLGVFNANLDVINCTISDNHAGTYSGGVGIFSNSTVNLLYTSIYGNSASTSGGGIHIYNSEQTVTNCTIYGNEASYGGGISNQGDANSNLENCILWNDTPQEIYITSGSVTATYSDIQGGWAGDGNIDEDPLFVDPVNDDFHLTEFSPCIDAGNPSSPPDPDGSIADIGRYFYLTPPSNLYVNENTGLFTWDAPVADDLTGYDVYLDGVFQDNTTDTEWQFTDLINGQEYTAGVEAIYDGVSSDLVTIDFTYTGTSAGNNLVSVTELIGNYPNPFNPTTTINYSLNMNSKVSLNIYNIKGQKVKQLVSDQQSAGQYSAVWNGKDDNGKSVSSGIYFYKLKTDNHEETKRMVLIK